MQAPETENHTVLYFCWNKMLYREIKVNAYNKRFISVSLQRKELVQVGVVLTHFGSLPRAAGEAQLFAMRGNASIPSRSGLAMGTAVMGGIAFT